MKVTSSFSQVAVLEARPWALRAPAEVWPEFYSVPLPLHQAPEIPKPVVAWFTESREDQALATEWLALEMPNYGEVAIAPRFSAFREAWRQYFVAKTAWDERRKLLRKMLWPWWYGLQMIKAESIAASHWNDEFGKAFNPTEESHVPKQ